MPNDSDDKYNKKKSIYNKYFKEQEKYSKIYGDKTIVFFQMGKFYDAYCTKTKGYLKLAELEPLLNIHFIRREENSIKNPHNKPNQFGINCVSIKKNLTTLIENGYTIIIFDQKTSNGEDIERVCTGVFSPGTYLSDRQTHDANYLLSVYIVEEKQLVGQKTLMAIGLTLVDITTGTSIVHEFYSNKYDEKFGLDELVRIMQIYCPTETIIYFHPVNIDENITKNIKSYLELDKYKNHKFYIYHNKKGNDELNLLTEDSFKISYQNDYLSKIYDLNHQLTLNKKQSAIEILNLERKSYVIISLLIILKYIGEHNVLLLKNLSLPEIYLYNKHLILGNNAIEQLNVIDSNNLEVYNHKIQSVFDVVNKTNTPMGKRFLKENLLNPISQENKQILVKRYELINELTCDKLYKKIQEELKNIYDMERLHRKMAMGIIVPYEFYRLDVFYQATTKIFALIKSSKVLRSIIPDATIKEFLSYQIKYNKEYDFEKLHNYNNLNDIDSSFFKRGIYNNIDKIQEKIDYVKSLINCTNEYLTNLILSRHVKKIKNNKDILTMESNERDGYYFTINKTNEKILKEELEKKRETIKIDLSIGETLDIKKDDIIFKPLPKGRTKIFLTPLIKHTTNLSQLTTKLAKLIKKIFTESMVGYYNENKLMMHKISRFIAEIDFLVSGAAIANEYYYCRPQIPSSENIPSYLKIKKLRHAIVERLCTETEYVPNDIELGNVPDTIDRKNGILLYGLNSVGKSCFMKSIGIAVILAQIGYYVPAEEFVYEPYMALYARITGNDNIFKGLSSFALEMTELDAILLRTEIQGPNTIVIGDEICRGTENTSGISLVASSLISLSECNSTFIFSTHLHDLPDIDEVKKLDNLRLFHLRVEYDEMNDCLIFDRKLTSGSGPKVYGLSVAKYLIKNTKFINRAELIKKQLMNENNYDIPSKKSNYNKDLLVKNCYVCNYVPKTDYHKELESHHINFQKNCLEDGKIKEKPYLNKNKLYNLVVLCRKCHNKVHKGEIIIRGYIDTSIGPLLDYEINIKEKMLNGFIELEKMEKFKKNSQKKLIQ